MKKPTDVATNRTGAAISPADSRRTIEGARAGVPEASTDTAALDAERLHWSGEAEPVGGMPPLVTLTGLAKAAVEAIRGHRPNVFLDLLGARLAFERAGVRAYEALLIKHAAANLHEGAPGRADLEQIRDEELEHVGLLRRWLETLGADPTAVTPTADLQGVAGSGLLAVLVDPRTTFTQGMETILIAELADNESWLVLADLAARLGHDEMAVDFRRALAEEVEHLSRLRAWVGLALEGQLGVPSEAEAEPLEPPSSTSP